MVRWLRWHCMSSRHRIRNSNPGGLRPSTLPLGHGGSPQYWLSHVDGEETIFVSFKPPRPGTEPRTLAWKAAVLTTTIGPPPERFRSQAPKNFHNFLRYNVTVQRNVPQFFTSSICGWNHGSTGFLLGYHSLSWLLSVAVWLSLKLQYLTIHL